MDSDISTGSKLRRRLLIFLPLLWMPLILIVVDHFAKGTISSAERRQVPQLTTVFDVFACIAIVGSLFSAYRCWKEPGVAKYVFSSLWIVSIPVQFLHWFALVLGTFGK